MDWIAYILTKIWSKFYSLRMLSFSTCAEETEIMKYLLIAVTLALQSHDSLEPKK